MRYPGSRARMRRLGTAGSNSAWRMTSGGMGASIPLVVPESHGPSVPVRERDLIGAWRCTPDKARARRASAFAIHPMWKRYKARPHPRPDDNSRPQPSATQGSAGGVLDRHSSLNLAVSLRARQTPANQALTEPGASRGFIVGHLDPRLLGEPCELLLGTTHGTSLGAAARRPKRKPLTRRAGQRGCAVSRLRAGLAAREGTARRAFRDLAQRRQRARRKPPRMPAACVLAACAANCAGATR